MRVQGISCCVSILTIALKNNIWQELDPIDSKIERLMNHHVTSK